MLTLILTSIRLFTLIVLTILTIMGWSKFTNSPIYVDREFRSFFNDFQNDAKRHNTFLHLSQLTISFEKTLPQDVAAHCFPKTNTVEVSAEIWQTLSTPQKKSLIYHELGHCVLLRDHVEDGILFSDVAVCPVSLMYPTTDPMTKCFPEFEELYAKELFTNPYNQKLLPERRNP
jgi:hypothetical protein